MAKLMVKAPEVAGRLGMMHQGEHEHVRLDGRSTTQADVYPGELCNDIVQGIRRHMEKHGRMLRGGL